MLVQSSEELIGNFKSDNRIQLINTLYKISDINITNNNNVFYRNIDKGKELVAHKISNLNIESVSSDKSLVLTAPGDAGVLNFRKCDCIYLNDIIIGHGFCLGEHHGAVLKFENSKTILLQNIDMFGYGSTGLIVDKCTDVIIMNSIIRECDEGIIFLNKCEGVAFINCKFIHNKSSAIQLSQCNNIFFSKCLIKDNENCTMEKSIVEKWEPCSNIEFVNCIFENNEPQCVSIDDEIKMVVTN